MDAALGFVGSASGAVLMNSHSDGGLMALLTFVLTGSAGILATMALVTRLVRRKDATDHQIASTAALGLAVTWVVSLMGPVLVGGSQEPGIALWIIAAIGGVSAGAVAYPVGRLLLRVTST